VRKQNAAFNPAIEIFIILNPIVGSSATYLPEHFIRMKKDMHNQLTK
jgi:hypothetical protein